MNSTKSDLRLWMRMVGETVRYAARCISCRTAIEVATPEDQRAWVESHRCRA